MSPNTGSRFEETLRSLHPQPEPSEALEERVAALAAAADARRSASQPAARVHGHGLRLAAAGLALAAVGGAASVAFLAPRRALAQTMRQVSRNLAEHGGVHYRLTLFNRGRVSLAREVWQRDDRWRMDIAMERTRATQIKAEGKFWHYEPAQGRAWYHADGSAVPAPLIIERLPDEAEQALGKAEGEDLGTEVLEGRELQKVAAPVTVQLYPFARPKPGRAVFWLDLERMLPLRMEQQLREEGRWVTALRAEFDFDWPVTEDVFRLPPGVRTYDVIAYGEVVGKRFARPLARKRAGSRTITLRHVEVNRDGDVFVLYTDGSTRDRALTSYPDLRDSLGMLYTGTAGAIDPFMYHQEKQSSRGLTVEGEVMRGFCKVPVEKPARIGQSRRLRIEVKIEEPQGKKMALRYARFEVPAPRPTDRLLPTYGPDLAALSLAGGNEERYLLDREWARRAHYFNKEDWPALLRCTDRALRLGVVDVNTYLDRARALRELRRPAEARQALAAARREDRGGFNEDQIREAERELGDAG